MSSAGQQPNVVLLERAEAMNRVMRSRFFERLDGPNLRARGAPGVVEYRSAYVEALQDAGDEAAWLKLRLSIVAGRAVSGDATGILRNVGKALPWLVALAGPSAEGGLAHTLEDMIVLPASRVREADNDELARLLAHERLHVLQRAYPVWAEHTFTRYSVGYLDAATLPWPVRANPDTDSRVYMDATGRGKAFVFSSRTPSSLHDGAVRTVECSARTGFRVLLAEDGPVGGPADEHPFEGAAYRLAAELAL